MLRLVKARCSTLPRFSDRLQQLNKQVILSRMSSFTLPNSSPECQVDLVPELSEDQLLEFPAFKQ